MRKILTSFVAAAVLGSSLAYATVKSSAQVSKESVIQAKKDAKNLEVSLIKEAVQSLTLTQKVLIDISKKDIKSAIKDLEDAIGKLEVILASKKAPKLLPVDNKIFAIEYVGDINTLKKAIEKVKTLVNEGKLQDARVLLNTLQSQINVITTYIPLATYPDALKLAAKYLHENKINEAATVLDTALNTLVQEETIIPIPIVKAEALINAASKVAKKDKKQALAHLDVAKKELELAKALGYVSKSDTTYKNLNDAIEAIEKEIKGKNKAEKLFEDLLKKIKDFKEKIVDAASKK